MSTGTAIVATVLLDGDCDEIEDVGWIVDVDCWIESVGCTVGDGVWMNDEC